ncbi:bZIP transcription factor [Aspergillus candidus]|uniref:BZIP domain-containing protein n=1 Tax=Aspergillus candidus TaxID=41067 RepID=A0A2I2FFD9_ASPCN|nr:hypothetical protein BDW47DRAFT_103488 [Aspergillus candidus]PLB39334.1 hypothetical protein BDW47DRAFT_103488 [Aspergillus candidus]
MTSHDTEDSEAPPPAPKKSGRSQSPRAMERRRLQNRIAQRNHRRRLKEQIAAEEAGEIQDVQPASTFQQTPSDPLPDSPSLTLSQSMDATLLPDDLFNQATSPWPGLDPMLIQMPAINPALNNPGQWAFPSPNGCTCNSITGRTVGSGRCRKGERSFG